MRASTTSGPRASAPGRHRRTTVPTVAGTAADGDTDGDTALDLAVSQARNGSETAFIQLYRAVAPGLLRYLGTIVGSYAEDVASEAWGQVSRDLTKFEGGIDNFRGWVTTIGRNRALDHLRAQGRRPATPVAPEDMLGVAGDHDTAGDALETVSTQAALALIATLPPDQAEAVLLRVVVGMSAASAAQVLGKQPGAVRTLTYRGLRTLSGRLERTEP